MNPHSYRLKGRDFVHQGKIEIDVNERAVFIRTQGCFFVYTNSDCFLNCLSDRSLCKEEILSNLIVTYKFANIFKKIGKLINIDISTEQNGGIYNVE